MEAPARAEHVYVLQVGVTVGVVPFVDADHVLLIRQFRHLTRESSSECPARRGRRSARGGRPARAPEGKAATAPGA